MTTEIARFDPRPSTQFVPAPQQHPPQVAPYSISSSEWLAATIAIVVQSGAFVPLANYINNVPVITATLGAYPNKFNTFSVALSAFLISIYAFPWRRRIVRLQVKNISENFLTLFILASAAWSIHPDITIWRSGSYVFTMLIASYISTRFCLNDVMRIFSLSLAFSAIGSVLFVAAFPEYGTMRELGGAWRGVFPHKNSFGLIAAIGVFVELYLISDLRSWRRILHLCLLIGYFSLAGLSQSATAVILASLFSIGASFYFLVRRGGLLAIFGLATIGSVGLLALFSIVMDPVLALSIAGREISLTGRTNLWPLVFELIGQKPLLGWGYGATWLAGDGASLYVWRAVGLWASNSHNGFLEIALQLGWLGMALLLLVIGIALRRAIGCCLNGALPLGAFALLFFICAILGDMTDVALAMNQNIEWLIFTVLYFTCGMELSTRNPKPNLALPS